MCWTTPAEDAARVFFRAHYVLWLIGELEPEVELELDGLSDANCENWKQVLQRELACSPDDLRGQFHVLCETRSIEEAVVQLLINVQCVITERGPLEPHRASESLRAGRVTRGRKGSPHRPAC